MNMDLVSPFYIYEGLEPTEGGTNTITPFRGRFQPISKFKSFWGKDFSREFGFFDEILNFVQRC